MYPTAKLVKPRWDSYHLKLCLCFSIMSAVAKIWKDNKVLIVMGGILAAGHFVWRELQDNTAFVPAGWKLDNNLTCCSILRI